MAKIVELEHHNQQLEIVLGDKHYKLEISTKHSDGGILKVPKNGLMDHEIFEN